MGKRGRGGGGGKRGGEVVGGTEEGKVVGEREGKSGERGKGRQEGVRRGKRGRPSNQTFKHLSYLQTFKLLTCP